MLLLVFHVERGGLGMVLGCVSPPLLAVVRVGVSRETIPLMEKNPSRRPAMFHVEHWHFHKQYSPCLQLCFVEAYSASSSMTSLCK